MSKLNKSRMPDKSRVQELIQSYGASPMRWPKAERQAGQAWLDDNPATAQKLLAGAHILDQALNSVHAPTSDMSLLQARILKTATNTAQNYNPHKVSANDTAPLPRTLSVVSAWKAAIAVLVLTTGMGFGIGQAAANTSYLSAEALLSMSMQSDYIEADLLGDEV